MGGERRLGGILMQTWTPAHGDVVTGEQADAIRDRAVADLVVTA